jgi:hypothetical protein
LGTKYPSIVKDLAELVDTPILSMPYLVVDQTGVGRAVIDMLKDSEPCATIKPILITGGHVVSIDDDGVRHVPKKELVSVLQVLLQGKRLTIAKVPERDVLVQELLNFKVKITISANETFEAWRERDHDDLVLAVALAAWFGEHHSGLFQDPGMPFCSPIGGPGSARPTWQNSLRW